MYANKNYKTDGKVYYMPNKIFDENFSPYEFMIYCFLVDCSIPVYRYIINCQNSINLYVIFYALLTIQRCF